MSRRARRGYIVVLAGVIACKSEQRASGDTLITTRDMSRALTRDAGASERELMSLQDSLYAFLGDSVAAAMKRAELIWKEYRNLECGALRLAFAEGSVAPVAQLECWVELTDDRRRFLRAEYSFAHRTR